MIVGITGTIASGKSTVSEYFIRKNYTVVDADRVSRTLQNSKEVQKLLAENFGMDILLADGTLNRSRLRNKVFQDKKALALLNDIMHPRVRAVFEEARKNHNRKDIVFFDIPLLFEANFNDLCDKVLLVSANYEIQIRRIQQRDGSSRDIAEKIISSQFPENEKRRKADYIIENNESFEKLYEKLEHLEETLYEDCRSGGK